MYIYYIIIIKIYFFNILVFFNYKKYYRNKYNFNSTNNKNSNFFQIYLILLFY